MLVDNLLNIMKEFKNLHLHRLTGDLKHLYKNELDNACFAHDAVHSDRRDFAKRTISDKTL